MIPTNDVLAGYLAQSSEIEAAVARVLKSGWYILGQEVAAFEQEYAAWMGVPHAVGVANGTDALMLALRALGVQPGDGVFTVSHTAVATVAAIEMAGAIPLLVDIDPQTYTMCPQSLKEGIRRADELGLTLRAVIPVHLYGHPCDVESICRIARERDLLIVEDCSQSHGARYHGRMTGTFGDAAAFSLYPTKNLGALGDAGVVTTASASTAERLQALRQYGWRERNRSEVAGVNSRLDELQAAILRVRLKTLDAANEKRREVARRYFSGLSQLPLVLPHCRPDCQHVYHQYVIQVQRRDEFQTKLKAAGVGTMIHYPSPVHLQPAYQGRLPEVAPLRETESVVSHILSLPMFPELNEMQTSTAIEQLQKICLLQSESV
jgi:dTDP-4-amino-4,6-dideoxygalactose transaminase